MINRLQKIREKFQNLFHSSPFYITRAPGRAEIIGNHTDYNNGFALGAAITLNTFSAVSPRNDNHLSVYSENIERKLITFSLSSIKEKNSNHWTNYIKAVLNELSKKKSLKKGFNLYITSDVPNSGGVSSSAALEISIAFGLNKLFNYKLSAVKLAVLCQKAENSPLVNSPCGFLDQGTCILAKKNHLLFLDFQPEKNQPISKIKHIPLNLQKHNLSFLIVIDKNVRRNLGSSGYPRRRKSCEQSLPILSKILGRKINSLREIEIKEFKFFRNKLNKINRIIRMRVEHVIYENQRVLDSITAIKNNDIKSFGKILTASGKSSLELFELDENTPELTFLVEKARSLEGVMGIRNMGGGFSANILALVKNSAMNSFTEKLAASYGKKYNNNLEFIQFQPSPGAEIYEV